MDRLEAVIVDNDKIRSFTKTKYDDLFEEKIRQRGRIYVSRNIISED